MSTPTAIIDAQMPEPYEVRHELDLCIRDRRPVPPEIRRAADYWVRRLTLEGHRGYARVIADRLTIADSVAPANRDAMLCLSDDIEVSTDDRLPRHPR